MLVSKSKFYKEVTGSATSNAAVTVAALERWKIPFNKRDDKGDCVDIAHLAEAKEAYQKELDSRPPPQVRNGELVQTIASRLASLEDQFNRFMNEQIRWNGIFGAKLDQATFKPPVKRKR